MSTKSLCRRVEAPGSLPQLHPSSHQASQGRRAERPLGMNKQLARIDREKVAAKVAGGSAISLAEAAVYYGLPYSTFRDWKKQGLPLLGGKFFDADFQLWRRRQTGLEPVTAFPNAVAPSARRRTANRSC